MNDMIGKFVRDNAEFELDKCFLTKRNTLIAVLYVEGKGLYEASEFSLLEYPDYFIPVLKEGLLDRLEESFRRTLRRGFDDNVKKPVDLRQFIQHRVEEVNVDGDEGNLYVASLEIKDIGTLYETKFVPDDHDYDVTYGEIRQSLADKLMEDVEKRLMVNP